MITVRLRRAQEAAARRGHPWIFSGAIAEISDGAQPGDVTDVVASNGEWIGRGLLQPAADLAVRLYTREQAQALDDAFFVARIDHALALRRDIPGWGDDSDAGRMVYAEADGLSGLIMDRYADALAVQLETRSLLPWLPAMIRRAADGCGATRVRVRVPEPAAKREGITEADAAGLAQGVADPVRIRQDGLCFDVDWSGGGQKTGFFLDQRCNRRRVACYARDRRMLSAYCYTGAFEVYAAAAGARSIMGMDSSSSALAQAARHHTLNGLQAPVEYRALDVPTGLRGLRDSRAQFDLIVLDPPRFVASRAQLQKGLRAYKDINLLAMKLLAPGGILATFSCSGLVTLQDFHHMLGWAAADARRDVRIMETLGQPPDHPVAPACPETEYLKGLICRID